MTDVVKIDIGERDGHRPQATAPASQAAVVPSTKPAGVPRVESSDPRYKALRNFAVSISVFNVFGYTLLGFEQPWAWPLLALAVAYVSEIVIELVVSWAARRPAGFTGHGIWGLYTFLLPATITALAVNMLLYANDRFLPVAFGVVVAISAKTVLRASINGRVRHFMNPSNFGITVTLLAFGSWVSVAPPYEFTEHVSDIFQVLIPMVILTAGTVLNTQLTRKVPLIVGWTGGFAIQALIRYWIWDIALWSALSVMVGVAFVLFTTYMVTDPGTSPARGWHQFVFGGSVAFVYGALIAFNVVYTLFFALTIVCFARGAYHWIKWLWQRQLTVGARVA